MSEIKIAPGDFVVVGRPYGRFAMVRVSKVTAVQFKASGEWSSRDSVYRTVDAVYAGPEAAAAKVLERLVSSRALYDDEKRKAGERLEKRQADIIARAND
jgi:hypothetical protein